MQKLDVFSKILLSIIALCLIVIALTLIFRSEPIQAQSSTSLGNIQLAYTNGGFLLMNMGSGDIWMYSFGRQNPDFIGRLTQLGRPLATTGRRR